MQHWSEVICKPFFSNRNGWKSFWPRLKINKKLPQSPQKHIQYSIFGWDTYLSTFCWIFKSQYMPQSARHINLCPSRRKNLLIKVYCICVFDVHRFTLLQDHAYPKLKANQLSYKTEEATLKNIVFLNAKCHICNNIWKSQQKLSGKSIDRRKLQNLGSHQVTAIDRALKDIHWVQIPWSAFFFTNSAVSES